MSITDPKFATVLADHDGHSRWVCHTDATDINDGASDNEVLEVSIRYQRHS